MPAALRAECASVGVKSSPDFSSQQAQQIGGEAVGVDLRRKQSSWPGPRLQPGAVGAVEQPCGLSGSPREVALALQKPRRGLELPLSHHPPVMCCGLVIFLCSSGRQLCNERCLCGAEGASPAALPWTVTCLTAKCLLVLPVQNDSVGRGSAPDMTEIGAGGSEARMQPPHALGAVSMKGAIVVLLSVPAAGILHCAVLLRAPVASWW